MDNKINFTITAETITQVNEGLATISSALKPYLLALSPEERQELPKMSDKTLPFVNKALDYLSRVPEFAPPYMDVEGLQNDMAVYNQLMPLLRQVRILSDNLDDTVMQAGGESYMAKSIADDLSKRFERSTTESEETVA
jgi:hypothetical protein